MDHRLSIGKLEEWRDWLSAYNQRDEPVWVEFHKDGTPGGNWSASNRIRVQKLLREETRRRRTAEAISNLERGRASGDEIAGTPREHGDSRKPLWIKSSINV